MARVDLDNVLLGRERAILIEATLNLNRAYRALLKDFGVDEEVYWVALVLYWGAFCGDGLLTVNKAALIAGRPRATVERKLRALVRAGVAVKIGAQYGISDERIKSPTKSNVANGIQAIVRAADQLRQLSQL